MPSMLADNFSLDGNPFPLRQQTLVKTITKPASNQHNPMKNKPTRSDTKLYYKKHFNEIADKFQFFEQFLFLTFAQSDKIQTR